MRIVFLTLAPFSQFPTYKRAVGTGEALAQLGHEVAIAVLDCPENRKRMALEAPHCEALWFRGGLMKEVVGKLAMVWKWQPDVLYSTSYSLHNLAGLRFLLPWKLKCVVEFCELYSQYPARRVNWAIWETMAIFEYRFVLCASRFLLDHFAMVCQKLHLRRSLTYAPYAYPDYLCPFPATAKPHKSIVFMASMGRGYGAFEVLEAFEKLIQKRHDVELEMIGGGPDKDEVVRWVDERHLSGQIHVRGFVAEDELNGYFSSADVFVSPMHDTLQDKARCPSKLFYYLPYNKPIVTCRIGNPYEVLGEYGFYYRSLDTDDMAAVFIRALDASEGFAYPPGFVESHTWAARARQMEDWLK